MKVIITPKKDICLTETEGDLIYERLRKAFKDAVKTVEKEFCVDISIQV